MATVIVEFHYLARKEYVAAHNWYACRSTSAGKKYEDAVHQTILRIIQNPETLQYLSGPYRWIRVRRFSYILVVRPRSEKEMVVVAVAHTSRRPGYWRRRKLD